MVELTIEITNYCPHECDFCSSNATKDGKHLSFTNIKKFVEDELAKIQISKEIQGLSHAPATLIDRINISGGEPLAHPDFYKILTLCKKVSKEVHVYTNEIEYLEYNTTVRKEIKVRGNVCLVPGQKVYIPKGNFSVKLLKLIPQGKAENLEHVKMTASRNLTGDCKQCNNPTLMANGKIVKSPCRKFEGH